MAERLRHGAEIIRSEPLRDIGVVEWLLGDEVQYPLRQGGDRGLVAGLPTGVGLAVHVIVDPGAVRIRIGDALVVLARNALRDGGVDADLGAGRYHAETLRQARIERFC